MGLFIGKESEQKSFEQTIERLKTDYANLEKDNKAKTEEISRLTKLVEALKNKGEQSISQETPVIMSENSVNTDGKLSDCLSTMNAVGADIKEIKALYGTIKSQLERREVQDENVRIMHKELERFRGDFYAKITKPYLMSMLDLHKRFFATYTHFKNIDKNEVNIESLYEGLIDEFKSAVDALENSIYNDFGVELYEPKENEEFDPKMHHSIEIVETTEPELHRKIAKVLYGGFRDLDSGKVLRTARVTCYKLSQTENN